MFSEENINTPYFRMSAVAIGIFCFFVLSANPSLVYSYGVMGVYLISFFSGFAALVLLSFVDTENKYSMSRFAIILFSIFIAPKIMSRPLAFDDWSYIGLGIPENVLAGIFYPINDHVLPVIKLILSVLDKWFYTSPLPFQLALVFSNYFLIMMIERICKYFDFNSKIILIILFVFVLSPSLSDARLWFAGGFWLTLSTALLLLFFTQVDSLIKSYDGLWRRLFFACITLILLFGTASQYQLVVLNILPILVYGFMESAKNRRKIVFLFFILSVLGINYALIKLSGHQGEGNGMGAINTAVNLVANLGYWIEAQIFSLINGGNYVLGHLPWDTIPPLSSNRGVAIVFGIFFLISSCIYLIFLKIKGIDHFAPLLFLYNIVLFVAEVGLGRGWDYNRILTGYYQMFPVVMLLLSMAPLFSIIRSKLAGTKKGLILVFPLGGLFFVSMSNYIISQSDLSLMYHQKAFLDEFSKAVCSVGKNEIKLRLLLNPINKFDKCKQCSYLMQADPVYLSSLSSGSQYFLIAKQLSRFSCPEIYYKYLIWVPNDDPIYDAFSGPLEWQAFNKKYFN